MAAIDMSLAVAHLTKRKNFAQREPGVIVVFAIVGAVAILMIGLLISKRVASLHPMLQAYQADPSNRWPPARLACKDTPAEKADGRDETRRVGAG